MWIYFLIGGLIGAFLGYNKLKESRQGMKRQPKRPFPKLWRTLLEDHIAFYNRLSSLEKEEFERKVHIFLLNVWIRGIETEVTHKDRILIASGAVIPIFYFEKWHYANLEEVLLYPDKFLIPESDKMAHGLVGWGAMEGKMMLDRKAIEHGFADQTDNKNVTIHEFIHILDKQDGKVDGMLSNVINEIDVVPWLNVINVEMDAIDLGNSTIRDYGAANKAEFLAVVSEYYFENSDKLRAEHPGLYMALDSFYHPRPKNNSVRWKSRNSIKGNNPYD